MSALSRLSIARFLATVAVVVVVACEPNSTAPDTATNELRGRAVALDVDLDARTVSQASASGNLSGNANMRLALLGHNEITATASNWTETNLSGPSRVRVRFDLTITNNLLGADLVPATFPEPPTGQVVAFPFSTEPASWWSNRVKVTNDWNGTGQPGSGAPWNFFNNDRHCYGATPPSDCYRWEAFGAVLAAGATSAPRNVGFDVYSSDVRRFRVYVVVAADIRERPLPAGTGGIAGTVTSPQRGALAGVQVSGGGHTATTGATGLFVLSGVTPGDVALTLNNLPAGCTAPAASVTVVAGEVAEAAISVTCPAAGTVEGQVMVGGVGLPDVEVEVEGTTQRGTTGAEGGFHIGEVLEGQRQLVLRRLPPACTNPGLISVTVNASAVAHVVINLLCASPNPEHIVATSVQTGNSELYIMNIDGSNQVRLTNTLEAEMQPTLSPDGSRIVFVRRASSGTARDRIFVINIDGTNEVPLTDLVFQARSPSWSPDGTRIAFQCGLPTGFGNELCVMNSDGSDLHIVVDGDGFSFLAFAPDWDPSSDRIVYVPFSLSNPDGSFAYVTSGGAAAGGITTNLDAATAPAFSPNGGSLAMSRLTADGDIYVVNTAGGSPVNLTGDAGQETSPTWTRDGSAIIYEKAGDLYRVSVSGGASLQLTSGGLFQNPHVR